MVSYTPSGVDLSDEDWHLADTDDEQHRVVVNALRCRPGPMVD